MRRHAQLQRVRTEPFHGNVGKFDLRGSFFIAVFYRSVQRDTVFGIRRDAQIIRDFHLLPADGGIELIEYVFRFLFQRDGEDIIEGIHLILFFVGKRSVRRF